MTVRPRLYIGLTRSVELHTLAFDGDAAGASMTGTAVAGVVSVPKVPVPNPTLWSTKNPVLHNLTVTYNGGSVTGSNR